MSTRWLRKKQVAARYTTTPRHVDRMVLDGRLPAPEHPLGPKTPMWDEQKLDAHDRAAVMRQPRRNTETLEQAEI
jgi:hypothetical protein